MQTSEPETATQTRQPSFPAQETEAMIDLTKTDPKRLSESLKSLRAWELETERNAQNAQKIAGYAVVVWDDTGRSAFSFRSGGPISESAIPSHVEGKIREAVRIILDRVK